MSRVCAAPDCSVVYDATTARRRFCSARCKARVGQRARRQRGLSPHGPWAAYVAERARIVAAVAARLTAAHDFEALTALARMSDFELDLLAQMEVAA